MSTVELSSPSVASVGASTPLLAQIAPAEASVVAQAATVPAAAAGPSSLGFMSGATPGTQIIRGDAHLPVNGDTSLLAGDRVVVPKGGSANVTFPGPTPNKAPLTGVLSGGADATIGVKQLSPGVDQVVVDLASGDMYMAAPDELADAASVAVKKKAAAAGGLSLLDGFMLGALGLGGLAALGSGGGGSDGAASSATGALTMVPPPSSGSSTGSTPGTPAPAPGSGTTTPGGDSGTPTAGSGLLAPTALAVDHATKALDGGILAGSGLAHVAAPVSGLAGSLTGALDGALAPLVGDSFTPNHPTNLDPVDNLAGTVTSAGQSVVSPVVDALLGNGATASLIGPVSTQVDFVTDAVSGLAYGLGLGPVLNSVYTLDTVLAPVNPLLHGAVSELLGVSSGLLAPVTGLLGELTGSQGLGLGGVVGGALTPVTGLLGELTGSLNGNSVTGGVSGLGNLLSPITGLLDTAGGAAPAPLDGLLHSLTGSLPLGDSLSLGGDLGGISTSLLGQGLGPIMSLLDSLPVVSAAGAGAGVAPATDLLSSLLGTLGNSASTGTVALNTSDLPLSAGGLLQPLTSIDPTGGLLGSVTGGLLGGTGTPSASGTLDTGTGGLLHSAGSLTDTTAVLGQLPGITSVADTLSGTSSSSPLSGLLNSLHH